jgi:hypothetical protein
VHTLPQQPDKPITVPANKPQNKTAGIHLFL